MREIDPENPHPCDILRPCFISPAQEREFEYLARSLRQSIDYSGLEQAKIVAKGFARDFGLTHDAATLLRVAAAEAALGRERRRASNKPPRIPETT